MQKRGTIKAINQGSPLNSVNGCLEEIEMQGAEIRKRTERDEGRGRRCLLDTLYLDQYSPGVIPTAPDVTGRSKVAAQISSDS